MKEDPNDTLRGKECVEGLSMNAARWTRLKRAIAPDSNMQCFNRGFAPKSKLRCGLFRSLEDCLQQAIGDWLGEGHHGSHRGDCVVIMDRAPSRHLFGSHSGHLRLHGPIVSPFS